MDQARVEWLTVEGDPDAWRSLGLTVMSDGLIPLFGTGIRVVAPVDELAPAGLVSWALSGIAETDRISDLATEVVPPRDPVFVQHDLGAAELDHVVIFTGDLEMVSGAIEAATHCELKRIREVGTIRQGFHRIGRGGLIVEIVHHAKYDRGVAEFWGLVINVDDIDAACELLGDDRVSAPKDAVQPGRRIATIKSDVGLGLPVALMSRG